MIKKVIPTLARVFNWSSITSKPDEYPPDWTNGPIAGTKPTFLVPSKLISNGAYTTTTLNAQGSVDLQCYRTAASQTTSGDFSFAAGMENTVSGIRSSAVGMSNIVSGESSSASGAQNTCSGDFSFVCGANNTASGDYSGVIGQNNTAHINGQFVHGAAGEGSSQASRYDLYGQTTAGGSVILKAAGNAKLTLRTNWAWCGTLKIIALNRATGAIDTSLVLYLDARNNAGDITVRQTDAWGYVTVNGSFTITANDTDDSVDITYTSASGQSHRIAALLDVIEVLHT